MPYVIALFRHEVSELAIVRFRTPYSAIAAYGLVSLQASRYHLSKSITSTDLGDLWLIGLLVFDDTITNLYQPGRVGTRFSCPRETNPQCKRWAKKPAHPTRLSGYLPLRPFQATTDLANLVNGLKLRSNKILHNDGGQEGKGGC